MSASLGPQHEFQESVPQLRGRRWGRTRGVQHTDARREHRGRPQIGVGGLEPIVDEGLSDSTLNSLSLVRTLACTSSSANAHTRITRSSAQCDGLTSVEIINRKRS